MRAIVIQPGQAPEETSIRDERAIGGILGGDWTVQPMSLAPAALAYRRLSGQAMPCRYYAWRWYYGTLMLIGWRRGRVATLDKDTSDALIRQFGAVEVKP